MLLSYKLLQINYYTLILNIYVLILYGRDYTISELFGFFHRLMLALLPIYLSTKFFVDAYQIFFWKRHTKTNFQNLEKPDDIILDRSLCCEADF